METGIRTVKIMTSISTNIFIIHSFGCMVYVHLNLNEIRSNIFIGNMLNVTFC